MKRPALDFRSGPGITARVRDSLSLLLPLPPTHALKLFLKSKQTKTGLPVSCANVFQAAIPTHTLPVLSIHDLTLSSDSQEHDGNFPHGAGGRVHQGKQQVEKLPVPD